MIGGREPGVHRRESAIAGMLVLVRRIMLAVMVDARMNDRRGLCRRTGGDRECPTPGHGHPTRRYERAQEQRTDERKENREARLSRHRRCHSHGQRANPSRVKIQRGLRSTDSGNVPSISSGDSSR